MKYMKHLLLLLLVLALAGCKTILPPEKLAAPRNVKFEELLTWDRVDNATGYVVYINDIPVFSDDNYYVISEEGEYEVYITAKAHGYEESDGSTKLNLSLYYENVIDPTISLSDNIISWDAVDDAISYNIFVNGTTRNIDTNSFHVNSSYSGVLEVSVQAVYPVGKTNVSNSVVFMFNLISTSKMQFQYSSNSTDDILLFDEIFFGDAYIEDSQGNIIDSNGTLTYTGEVIRRAISSAYLLAQTVDTIEFNILVGNNRIPIEITLTDKETPYIISSSIITTDGTEDIQLQFELFDGGIYSINGTSEDTVLYSVDGSVLTIEKEFIAEKFLSSDEFMLSYVLNIGEDSVIGYLHFNKTTSN